MSDLIRKTDAIEALYKAWGLGWIEAKCEWIAEACKQTLDALPTVEPERGEWIKRTHNTLIAQVNFAYCSECGQPIMHEHTRSLWNFCPNCGADMREREGE